MILNLSYNFFYNENEVVFFKFLAPNLLRHETFSEVSLVAFTVLVYKGYFLILL